MIRTEHVVVLESSAPWIKLIRLVLRSIQVENVSGIESREAMFRTLRTAKVDALILAHRINGICNLDIVRQIRDGRTDAALDIPIFLLTDDVDDSSQSRRYREDALAMGVTDCINRPLSIKNLAFPVWNALSAAAADECATVALPFDMGAVAARQTMRRQIGERLIANCI